MIVLGDIYIKCITSCDIDRTSIWRPEWLLLKGLLYQEGHWVRKDGRSATQTRAQSISNGKKMSTNTHNYETKRNCLGTDVYHAEMWFTDTINVSKAE